MLTNFRSSAPAFEVFNLTCRDCSWRQRHIVTPEYARTLRIQHEFRYDHVVEESNA